MGNYWRMLLAFTGGALSMWGLLWLISDRLAQDEYPYTPPACYEGEVFSEEEGCHKPTGYVLTVINN